MRTPSLLRSARQRCTRLFSRLLASLQDTLSSRSHSRDFVFARNEYLCGRVTVVAMVFLALLPFWAILDWFMLAGINREALLIGRLAMLFALVLVIVMARCSKTSVVRSRSAAILLLLTPALFYAYVLVLSPKTGTPLIGYSFIPYLLVSMLAIFPLTLLEAGLIGLFFLLIEAFALQHQQVLYSGAGLQALWLLAALLSVSVSANYFQLGLMLRLYREATHDPLTGLLNRGALLNTVSQIKQKEPHTRLAVLMLDLDYFKRINDTFGHTFGDIILRDFTQILHKNVRPTDVIARYGGEEFIAVLSHSNYERALSVAEAIRSQTEARELLSYDDEPVNYTVSIGVTTLAPSESFHEALRRADAHLYSAKAASRNRVVGGRSGPAPSQTP